MAVVWQRFPWAISTGYTIGQRVTNASVVVDGIPLPCVYRCAAPGTSAGSGSGPAGTDVAAPIVDGSGGLVWQFIGPFGGEVIALAPDLSTVSALEQVLLLDLADTSVGDCEFGTQAAAARIYLAAHLATMAAGGGTGAIGSEAVGPISQSYVMAPGMIGDLALTSYGAVFRRLQLATGAGMGFNA